MADNLPVVGNDFFSLSDRLDEDAVLAELSGVVVQAYVYQFRQGSQTVKGLSKAGVDAVCRHLSDNNEVIRELELVHDVDLTTKQAFFRAKAGRYKVEVAADGTVRELLLDTGFGTKRQPMTYQNGSPDPHWYEKGAAKACRNARRRLIPEAVAVELIAQWSGEKKRVRQVEPDEPPPRGSSEPPPKSSRAQADEQKARNAGLTMIKTELAAAFGDGAPWEDPDKQAALKLVFQTSNWKSISTTMPYARFAERCSEKAIRAACSKVADAKAAAE